MTWYILHQVWEQVSVQSRYRGKLLIALVYCFRIIMVTEISDQVYSGGKSILACNTETPGCANVCFNSLVTVSRPTLFWTLMIYVVPLPSISFFIYAAGVVYCDTFKLHTLEDKNDSYNSSAMDNQPLDETYCPSQKRRKCTTPEFSKKARLPLYEVSKPEGKSKSVKRIIANRAIRRFSIVSSLRGSNNNNGRIFDEDLYVYCRKKYSSERENTTTASDENVNEKKQLAEEKLKNSSLFCAYWCHMFIRTIFEVSFLVGQYYLYGLSVDELYKCSAWPCPKTVHCFLDKSTEKTCLLWIMYGLGAIACLLSVNELWQIELEKVKIVLRRFYEKKH